MRIAITADPFIPVPPVNYGGIERIISFLAEELQQNGHEVILVAHPDSKVNVELMVYPSLQNNISGIIRNTLTVNKLKHWKPDVIHSFGRLAYLLPLLRTNIPKLMSYQREPTLSQISKAMAIAKKNTLAFSGCSNYISEKIKPYAPAYTVYNGIELKLYDFQAQVEDDAPLMFLGRIEPVKGTHIAVEAALATNRKLIIAGNIPAAHQGYFDSQIKPFLNNNITYVGPVNDTQKNELLGRAAALLMTIQWNEPFGIVMAEAMACGTPVIAYPYGAVPEVVEHGVNGFIATDLSSLCVQIKQLNEISRTEVRRSAETRFSSKKITDDYIRIYNMLKEGRLT